MADDGFNPDSYAVRHLSCRERKALKERFIARANEERRRLLRRCAVRTGRALRQAWQRVSSVCAAVVRYFIAKQGRLAALRQLAAMSDRELRDIGISRLEIRAATQSEDAWPRGDRAIPAIKPTHGGNHAKGLLDRPRLCS
jgi:uncharacterized protein YjiS (DUF1127 family)